MNRYDIFPDPKYCFDYTFGKRLECQFIADLNYCEKFDVEDMEVEQDSIRTIKCQQCKEFCKQSLSKEENADRELGTT